MKFLSLAIFLAGIIFLRFDVTSNGKVFFFSYIAFGCLVFARQLSNKMRKLFIYALLFMYGVACYMQYQTLHDLKELAIVHFCFAALLSLFLIITNEICIKNITDADIAQPFALEPIKRRASLYIICVAFLLLGFILGMSATAVGGWLSLEIGATGGIALMLPAIITAFGYYAIFFSIVFCLSLLICFVSDTLITQHTSGLSEYKGLIAGIMLGGLAMILLSIYPEHYKLDLIIDRLNTISR